MKVRKPINRILVPVDFSPDSQNALRYAADLAAVFGAEIMMLHVVEPVYVAEPYLGVAPEFGMFLDEQMRNAKAVLAGLGTDLKKKGQRVRTMVTAGPPALLIVDTAKDIGTDLIVMGTHGRTGLAHMFIGSVAEKVVRTAQCPVLTVRGAASKRTATKRVR
ncbi:MAG TPA: universal stress protein [Candidatus Binatia bacterium]